MIGDALVDVKEGVVDHAPMDVLVHVPVAATEHVREVVWEIVKEGVPVVVEVTINQYEFC